MLRNLITFNGCLFSCPFGEHEVIFAEIIPHHCNCAFSQQVIVGRRLLISLVRGDNSRLHFCWFKHSYNPIASCLSKETIGWSLLVWVSADYVCTSYNYLSQWIPDNECVPEVCLLSVQALMIMVRIPDSLEYHPLSVSTICAQWFYKTCINWHTLIELKYCSRLC